MRPRWSWTHPGRGPGDERRHLLFDLQNKAVLARQQIRESYEMLRATQRLVADLTHAEAAQRDTMLAIDPTLAAAFDRAVVQAEGDERSLSTMASANPKLGGPMLRLVGVVDLELAHLREMIASPQAGSTPPALRHAILQLERSAEIETINRRTPAARAGRGHGPRRGGQA